LGEKKTLFASLQKILKGPELLKDLSKKKKGGGEKRRERQRKSSVDERRRERRTRTGR